MIAVSSEVSSLIRGQHAATPFPAAEGDFRPGRFVVAPFASETPEADEDAFEDFDEEDFDYEFDDDFEEEYDDEYDFGEDADEPTEDADDDGEIDPDLDEFDDEGGPIEPVDAEDPPE